MSQGFGMKERRVCQPTYVYPKEVKMLLRSVFSENICDYPDPCRNNVSVKCMHDLLLLHYFALKDVCHRGLQRVTGIK